MAFRLTQFLISVDSSIICSSYSVHESLLSDLNPTPLHHPFVPPWSLLPTPFPATLPPTPLPYRFNVIDCLFTCLLHRKVSESPSGIFQTPSTLSRRRGTSRLGLLSTTAIRGHGRGFMSLKNSSHTHRVSGMPQNPCTQRRAMVDNG